MAAHLSARRIFTFRISSAARLCTRFSRTAREIRRMRPQGKLEPYRMHGTCPTRRTTRPTKTAKSEQRLLRRKPEGITEKLYYLRSWA